MAFLEIDQVVKDFGGGAVAVAGVSLAIERGEIFALLGSSGCGKTTLLRMLAGFETPTRGRITLAGQDLIALPPHVRPINMMFQSYALFPHLTVRDNIAFGLRREGRPRAEVAERVEAMLDLVQLRPYARRKPHQLSGGQQQRVALARSLAKRPSLLLLDEPLGALDRKLREETQIELARIIREVGVTCVMVTHDQEEAMTLASRIAVMSEGRLLQVDAPREIYERPATRFVADFVGNVNLMDGRLEVDEPDHVVVACADVRHRVGHGISGSLGQTLAIALRPEKIQLTRAAPPDTRFNAARVRIQERSYFGAHTVYHLRLASGARLKASLANTERQGEEQLSIGDEAWAHWSDLAQIVLTQ